MKRRKPEPIVTRWANRPGGAAVARAAAILLSLTPEELAGTVPVRPRTTLRTAPRTDELLPSPPGAPAP
ncbi:MAG TPA: hypothetical protein VFU47_03880 [Armatimonadota bacterium]|nr:hypothetical protein [Armatimonadota bacterium]